MSCNFISIDYDEKYLDKKKYKLYYGEILGNKILYNKDKLINNLSKISNYKLYKCDRSFSNINKIISKNKSIQPISSDNLINKYNFYILIFLIKYNNDKYYQFYNYWPKIYENNSEQLYMVINKLGDFTDQNETTLIEKLKLKKNVFNTTEFYKSKNLELEQLHNNYRKNEDIHAYVMGIDVINDKIEKEKKRDIKIKLITELNLILKENNNYNLSFYPNPQMAIHKTTLSRTFISKNDNIVIKYIDYNEEYNGKPGQEVFREEFIKYKQLLEKNIPLPPLLCSDLIRVEYDINDDLRFKNKVLNRINSKRIQPELEQTHLFYATKYIGKPFIKEFSDDTTKEYYENNELNILYILQKIETLVEYISRLGYIQTDTNPGNLLITEDENKDILYLDVDTIIEIDTDISQAIKKQMNGWLFEQYDIFTKIDNMNIISERKAHILNLVYEFCDKGEYFPHDKDEYLQYSKK